MTSTKRRLYLSMLITTVSGFHGYGAAWSPPPSAARALSISQPPIRRIGDRPASPRRLVLSAAIDNADNSRNQAALDRYYHSFSSQMIQGVTLKLAFDRQGGVAELESSSTSERFTCSESLDMVHRLRKDCDAVLVGRKTVQADDCSLTVRRVEPKWDEDSKSPKQPTRVIIDSKRSLQSQLQNYKIATDGLDTIIYYHDEELDGLVQINDDLEASYSYEFDENFPNVQWVGMAADEETGQLSAKDMVRDMKFHQSLWHILVEGGPATARQFLQQGLVDRAILVFAAIEFQIPAPSHLTRVDFEAAGLELIHQGELGVDRVEYWSRPGLPWPEKSNGSDDDDLTYWP